jgi:Uma2 family endonuclease
MSQHASKALPDGLKPAWDLARLFPPQGSWSEEEYLSLPGNHLSEFDHGRVEVLEMPIELHQRLVAFLFRVLLEFVNRSAPGVVLFAPFPIRLWEGKIREPDLVFMHAAHAHRRKDKYWEGADLVMEVLSPEDPKRDKDIKRREYAVAGIPEYWLIDPTDQSVTVFVIEGGSSLYSVKGVYREGLQAVSPTLPGFAVDVRGLFRGEPA